ncbi:hypothetical protein [Rhodococcoides fascians]|uniref:hypothetical protein n=1 Tax=Rhodococcoides fascians TaxID=1828 RepID=UPI0005625BF3|nr:MULTISPECIES: hypothetical protein [Rhodococcus]OZF05568.1 hypothetical protein CH301_04045 [Rhodococcus sp. 15-1189-1-1a]OZF20352.1 hypothetical protein CH299_04590 [Rhodococcus sp. 14-2686-1-2]
MSFTDTLNNLTGRQIKRVEQLTGTVLDKSDSIGLTYAVGYVLTLHHEQVKNFGQQERDGFEEYLDGVTYLEVRKATGQEDEESDPKDNGAYV